jgi:hypothetical protein
MKTPKNLTLSFKINTFLYFFVPRNKISGAIFSELNFPTSPNFYKSLILIGIFIFLLGEVYGEVLGKYGEVKGKFRVEGRKLPQGLTA